MGLRGRWPFVERLVRRGFQGQAHAVIAGSNPPRAARFSARRRARMRRDPAGSSARRRTRSPLCRSGRTPLPAACVRSCWTAARSLQRTSGSSKSCIRSALPRCFLRTETWTAMRISPACPRTTSNCSPWPAFSSPRPGSCFSIGSALCSAPFFTVRRMEPGPGSRPGPKTRPDTRFG
jgi:hypothetical protein